MTVGLIKIKKILNHDDGLIRTCYVSQIRIMNLHIRFIGISKYYLENSSVFSSKYIIPVYTFQLNTK